MPGDRSADLSTEEGRLLRRVFTPSLTDILFLSLIGWLFLAGAFGWSGLLADGDTGWHIRTGEYILERGEVPRQDLYSFSRPLEKWFAWEWGADVVFALLYREWHLRGVVWFAGMLVGLFAVVVLLWSLDRTRAAKGEAAGPDPGNPLICLPLVLLAMGAASIHFLARPHLFTLVLLPLCLWVVDADRRRPSGRVWLVVPAAGLWTNLHGGFLALIASVALVALGAALERKRAEAVRYASLTALCLLATLANPYGVELHKHVIGYLQSDWIRNAVEEFQAPRFRNENQLQYEILLFAGLAAATTAVSRGKVVEALWILFWAHQSLASVRHVTVFAAVAAPVVAGEAAALWRGWARMAAPSSLLGIFSALSRDTARRFAPPGAWAAAAAFAVLLWPSSRWPVDFPAARFPTGTVARHAELLRTSRPLAPDQWANYLVYRFYPEMRVFLDGRSDFYGPGVGRDYLRLSGGHYTWRSILEQYRFNVVLAPPTWPLTSLLKQEAGWRVLDDDGRAVLFAREDPAGPGPRETARSSLMNRPGSAELTRGVVPSRPAALKQEKNR